MDQSVTATMTRDEWDAIIRIIATKEVWAVANPLLMKLGQQMQTPQPINGPLQREAQRQADEHWRGVAAAGDELKKPS